MAQMSFITTYAQPELSLRLITFWTWKQVRVEQRVNFSVGKITQISFTGGGDLWWWYLIGWGWGRDMGMGFQTWRWGSRHGDRVPDMEMGFQTWRWGSRHGDRVPDKGWGSWHGDGLPDMGVGFQPRDGVPDMGMGFQTGDGGTRHRWGSRHGMKGYQTEGGVPVRGGVTFTTFTSHQSGILHSLIFLSFSLPSKLTARWGIFLSPAIFPHRT